VIEWRKLLSIAALSLALSAPKVAAAQELTVWHAYAEPGVQLIQRIADSYKESHPGVVVKSISMPRDQWLARSIAAINTNTAPDIIFYDNDLMVQVQKNTGKLTDLAPVIADMPSPDRSYITQGDISGSSFAGKVIMLPVNRAIVGLGARKSWLVEVGETFPKTWDDYMRVAGKFKEKHKDGYPIGLHAGAPSAITYAGIDLFAYGSGAPHVLVDNNGDIVIDQPYVAKPLVEYLKLFTEYKYVSPETTNYTYVELNQMVEAGKVGLFRVGNWSVAKWDKDPPAGDYEVGPYPSFGPGTGAMIVSTLRGVAVPDNAPNKDAALSFVKYMVSQPAQQAFLDILGGAIRTDLDISHVTPGLRAFLAKDVKLQTDDFASAVFPWYGKLQESYYRLLLDAISNPPKDWDAWVQATAAKLRAIVADLKKA
jgi:multiple sugar transport system substrate-binding protein